MGEIEATSIMLETLETETGKFNGEGSHWRNLILDIKDMASMTPDNIAALAVGIRNIRRVLISELGVGNADSHYLHSQRIRMSKAMATSIQARLSGYHDCVYRERAAVIDILGEVTHIIKVNKQKPF